MHRLRYLFEPLGTVFYVVILRRLGVYNLRFPLDSKKNRTKLYLQALLVVAHAVVLSKTGYSKLKTAWNPRKFLCHYTKKAAEPSH